jgi:sec-independent protein translocase protein TatC
MAHAQHRHEPEESGEEPGGAMGFLEHLDELRSRIIRSCIAIAGGMAAAFVFRNEIVDFVLEPTMRMLPAGSQLIYTRGGEAFSFYFNVCFAAGVILAAPFISYQVWRFIAPGLYANEKRFVGPFVVLATLSAVSGALFSHYFLYPGTMAFFAAFDSPQMRFMPRIEDTLDQYLKMLLAMVVVFQLPTVVFFLARMGLVTACFLWRNIKYAVVIIFVAAAVLTSSADAWNQTLFAAPMIGLYLVSIGIAWLAHPRRTVPGEAPPVSTHLRLVVAATVVDQARRHATPAWRPRRVFSREP